jgi:hypothetical protein
MRHHPGTAASPFEFAFIPQHPRQLPKIPGKLPMFQVARDLQSRQVSATRGRATRRKIPVDASERRSP